MKHRAGDRAAAPGAWRLLPPALCVFAVLAVFFTGALCRRRVFEDLAARLSMEADGLSVSLAAGDAPGEERVREASPAALRLPAGTYLLTLNAETDGEGEVRISFLSGADPEPRLFPILAGETEKTVEIRLDEDTEGMRLALRLLSGGYARVKGISLASPPYNDRAWAALGAALLFCFFWFSFAGPKADGASRLRSGALAAAVIAVSLPLLRGGAPSGHDFPFHMARLENLKSALSEGQIPARVGGFTFRGYGAASSVFYPDVFLVPFALMRLLGASAAAAYNAMWIALHAASCGSMYLAAKRIGRDENAACCCACLYTAAAYRLSNFAIRAAVGESLAMVFLPLFFCGLWQVLCEDGDGRLLAVSAACVFLSHFLSALLCAVFAALAVLLRIRPFFRGGRWRGMLLAAAGALLLCAFQLAPLFTLAAQGVDTGDLLKYRPAAYVKSLGEVFRFQAHGSLGLLLLAAGGFALLAPSNGKAGGACRQALSGALLFSCLAAALTAWQFPWTAMSHLTRGFSDYVQFPWRLLGFATVFLSFAAGWAVSGFWGKKYGCALALLLSLAFAAPQIHSALCQPLSLTPGEGAQSMTPSSEYMLEGAARDTTGDQQPRVPEGMELSAFQKRGTRMEMRVSARQGGVLSLPVFAFDGYEARLDGETLETGRGADSRLTVTLPAGAEGRLSVRYRGKGWWRIFDGASLAAWLWVAFALRRRKSV